jgi:hypothetical protein
MSLDAVLRKYGDPLAISRSCRPPVAGAWPVRPADPTGAGAGGSIGAITTTVCAASHLHTDGGADARHLREHCGG